MPDSLLTYAKKLLRKYYLWVALGVIVMGFTMFLGRNLFVQPSPIKFTAAKPVNVITGPPENRFNQPTAVAVGLRGELFIADSGNKRIIVMEENGRYSFSFGGPGSGRAELGTPVGLVVSPDGKLYVADREKEAVIVFNSAGAYLYTIAETRRGNFVPLSVSVDRKGNVYIFDGATNKIRAYDSAGKKLTDNAVEKISGLKNITAMDVELEEGWIFGVSADQKSYHMVKGGSLQTWGKNWLVRPQGIAYNRSKKLVLISDASTNKIVVFDWEGKYLGEFGGTGDGMANLKNPAGIAIDERGKLFIADKDNNRVVVYTL